MSRDVRRLLELIAAILARKLSENAGRGRTAGREADGPGRIVRQG